MGELLHHRELQPDQQDEGCEDRHGEEGDEAELVEGELLVGQVLVRVDEVQRGVRSDGSFQGPRARLAAD